MIPTIDERLASVIRSLSDIILPGLREDASLAKEQARLAIGHLDIIRQQLDQAPDFEAKELENIENLAQKLIGLGAPADAVGALQAEVESIKGTESVRDRAHRLNGAVSAFLKKAFASVEEDLVENVNKIVLAFGTERALLDRQWFAPMGFDGEILDQTK